MMSGKPIDLFLTIGEDGKGVLTFRRPIITQVLGTGRKGVYVQPGDPVLLRELCSEWVEKVLGFLPPVNSPIRCSVAINALPGAWGGNEEDE